MTMPAALQAQNLSFAYATPGGGAAPVLDAVSLEVPQGAFALLVGGTGSGKTTLLRLAKPEVSPVGDRGGGLRVFGEPVEELAADPLRSASRVGFVFQSPQSQIVCDSVWREMAFGLENLGVSQVEMRRRIAETCYFLGMEPWFRSRTTELSGGQAQILSLASVLAMRPRLLLLDEPTSMLDPVAEKGFLALLRRVNQELGVTVLLATHRPGPLLDFADMALELKDGRVHELALEELRSREGLRGQAFMPARREETDEDVLELSDVWFRHARDARWVLRGLDLSLGEGECRAVVGGNGCGKSTLLALAAGVLRPQRGRMRRPLAGSQALLPQDPKALLSAQSVSEELMEWFASGAYGWDDVQNIMNELGICQGLAKLHPYDLSGGQQQLVALVKLLLVRPRLLLLDEPSKGLDQGAWHAMVRMLLSAREEGATILLATHDMDLVRVLADSVTLLFDGQAGPSERTGDFFDGSWLWR